MAWVDSERNPPNVPDEMNGIPISFREAPNKTGPATTCTNKTTDQTVEGGQLVRSKSGGFGTASGRVIKNGSEYLLHCAHTFWSGCDDTASDITDIVAADSNGDAIGKVTEADINGDYVLIDTSKGGDYLNRIDSNETTPPELTSYVTYDTLSYWVSLDKSERPIIENMGVTTGRTERRVDYINYSEQYSNSCVDFNNGEGVYTSADFGDGDSGGPTFYESDGGTYLVSCTTYYYLGYTEVECLGGNQNVGSKSCGTGAYSIANESGVEFGKGEIPL